MVIVRNEAADAVKKSLLEWLHSQDHHERIEGYKENEKYYEGDLDVKIPTNVKAVIEKEFAFTGNLCRPVVDASVRFLSKEPLAVEVDLPGDVDEEEGEDDKKAAEAFIYDILRESKLLRKNFLKALRIQGKKGEFALKAYPVLDDNEQIAGYKISVLRPDICYPKWANEEHEEMEYFAIKYIRSNPETGEKEVFAQVLWPNEIREYTKPIGASDVDQWTEIDRWETNYGVIPIEWIQNKADDGPWSEADITIDLKDIQDAFNKAITDLSYAIDTEAFRTAFILGTGPPTDKDGDPKPLESGPGKTHFIPGRRDGQVPSLGEFSPSNFEGLLNAVDKYLELVSTVTNTPKNELSRTAGGGTPTGVALRTIYQPFIGKTNEKAALFASGMESLIRKIFRMAEVDGYSTDFEYYDYNAEVRIAGGLPEDEKEQTEILETQTRNHWKSRETAMQEIGIEDTKHEKELIRREMAEMDVYGERVAQELEEELEDVLEAGEEVEI